jgi:2'-5' RNA ligase
MIPPVATAVREMAAQQGAMTLNLGDLGVFPDERRVRIAWCGCAGGGFSELVDIQNRLELLLEGFGWPVETRDFFPHFTLVRVKSYEAGKQIVENLRKTTPVRDEFRVGKITLYSSVLTKTGAQYRAVEHFPLLGPARAEVSGGLR